MDQNGAWDGTGADISAQQRIRELVLQAYAEYEEQVRDEVA